MAESASRSVAESRYAGAMSKDKNKKREAKSNKPKLTAKEKKAKKAAKKAK